MMIIDCHQHLPSIEKTGALERSKTQLLEDLRRNKVDYAILIPDNTPKSNIGSLDEVLKLVKSDRQLYVMGTIDIQKRNYSNTET